jgi:methionyl-tRNA formyltransferase
MSTSASAVSPALKIVFAGTPDFAREHLQALVEGHYLIVGAYTQPDRASGRGKKTRPTPVKAYALEQHIPVLQPASLKGAEAQAELAALQPDAMVVVAYGLLLPQAVLDIPRLGCINVHASLLPRWRGAAPIERAIAAGDKTTGVTIMQMEAGLDTGPMLSQQRCPIDAQTTGDSLRHELAQLGSVALLGTLQQMASGPLHGEIQNDALSCYAPKLSKAEAWIDWSQDAATIARHVRAFCSSNVALSQIGDERIKIWMAQAEPAAQQQKTPGTVLQVGKNGIDVACGQGVLRITRLQLAGGKPLPVDAILNGRASLFAPGARFHGQA